MEKQKNNKRLIILILVFAILILVLGGFILYDKLFANQNSITDNYVTENSIDDIVIENSEVQELYNYVQANLNSNSICLGYFYQNPFANHTLEDKISLVLINYASNYEERVDDNFLQQISQNDREHIKVNSLYYINADRVREGMKLIFNIDVDEFDDEANYKWHYRSDADAFVSIDGGGAYPANPIQQIIEYNELDDEINLIVVKAELDRVDGNVYRYAIKTNTLVFENAADNFQFTKENISKFPQLKYIFKKNDNGKYYVSDIINLNFEEDFEDCNY